MKSIAPLIMLTALLIGLPMIGATSAGYPISRYLEFPPHTRYVQHAPFSWPAFALVGGCALLTGAMGCTCVGYSGLAGLALGYALGIVPSWLRSMFARDR